MVRPNAKDWSTQEGRQDRVLWYVALALQVVPRLQDIEMYLYSNGFLKPNKKKAKYAHLSCCFAIFRMRGCLWAHSTVSESSESIPSKAGSCVLGLAALQCKRNHWHIRRSQGQAGHHETEQHAKQRMK